MDITCISDLHGYYPELEVGDLLIIAGDLTFRGTTSEQLDFFSWLQSQKYKKRVFIAGNHDNFLKGVSPNKFEKWSLFYLCDSGTEFEGLKIWGSPWTKSFEGMNPKYKAFTLDTEEELAEKWALIPDDIDILVTHSPPHGTLDSVDISDKMGYDKGLIGLCVGSKTLQQELDRIRPKLHIFGHVHESYGKDECGVVIFVNASHVNEHYEPVNNPIKYPSIDSK